MADLAHLESVAAQLIARVHEKDHADDPQPTADWLAEELPDPGDWFRLAFALAAAVPTSKTWRELTEWSRTSEEIAAYQRVRREALRSALARRAAA